MKILLWENRRMRGVTLEKLAEISGISKSTLQRIESELTSPTMENMEKIAMALNVGINDLYDSDHK